jgi:alpha-beta hydrolase superfamily lysophospholipase
MDLSRQLNIQIVWKLLAVVFILLTGAVSAVEAEPTRDDNCPSARELRLPMSCWTDACASPKAVVVMIHGLLLHAKSFDVLGKTLASQGFVVVAPDLRGCGRWRTSGSDYQPSRLLDHQRSYEDILALTHKMKTEHPGLPIFLVGESMGAALAIQVGATEPDLVNGLVLASPAIKGQVAILPKALYSAMKLFSNPRREIDLSTYVKNCSSDDPRVPDEIFNDPLARRGLSLRELVRSLNTVKLTLKLVKRIPPQVPVLVIQGSADRTLKANAVILLLARLRSVDQTVKWFPGRGHVLLETGYIQPVMQEVVGSWLSHQAALTRGYHAASVPQDSKHEME